MSLLHDALAFAAECHKDQLRDGVFPLPYLHHPMEVAHILRWTGGIMQQEILAAALLHDTVEEGSAQPQALEERFGPRVTGLVKELTRREPSPDEIEEMNKEEIYQLRTQTMLTEIRHMSADAMTIKLADRISNLQEALLVRSPGKLERYKGQTRLILKEIPRDTSPKLWDTLASLCDFE